MKQDNSNLSTTKSSEENTINEKSKANSDEELLLLIDNLIEFESYTKSIQSVNDILTKENFQFFNKLSLKENIKINLLLSKIYMNIISNDSLYNEYLLEITENDKDKIEILFQLIDNCISIADKLNTFVFSEELYNFKKQVVEFIKCIYYNCKGKIKEEAKLDKLVELIDSVPSKFFSNTFIELNKAKELYEISRTKEVSKITNFEEKFSEINNYYEQFDAFRKFVENNSGVVNCSSVNEESFNTKSEILDFKPNNDKIDFYEQYGTLLLKFCKYHNYMFLDKEEEEEIDKSQEKIQGKPTDIKKDKEKKEGEEGQENDNIRTVFLLDKNDQEKSDDEIDKNKKIENLLKNKQFVSSVESKEYDELIKKEINYYLKATINIEKDEKIKKIKEHLAYYLSILDVESYYPLYLKDLTKITITDSFTPSYFTNVPAGQTNKFYFETEENEDTLVYIEFSLEDKSKDITFELNKFESNLNKFTNIYKEEKIENTFKFFIFCHGYSLYEIIFDNYYSWFNSKDINFRVSLLKLSQKSKKEDENEFNFNINGKNYYFNNNELVIKKKEANLLNIPVVLNLNNLKIASFKKNENENNEKNECELVFKEHKEDDEKIIPKHLFNYLIVNHIKKQKVEKDKKYKILISIFSENRDLLPESEEIKSEFDRTKTFEKKNYLKTIGFCPDEKIDDFKIEYKLYDKDEMILTYHVFFNIQKGTKISKLILILDLSKPAANATIYNKGEIITKLRGKDINFKNINYDNIDEILELIKSVSEIYKEIELVLNSDNSLDEENKNKVLKLIGEIKTYCQEKVDPAINIFEYEESEIVQNVIKYVNSLYEN
jgi:hypothetical protein